MKPQPLSQLENEYADYAKDVSKVFIGKGLHMPGIKKSKRLNKQYTEYLVRDMQDFMEIVGKITRSFVTYIRTSNPAHTDRIKDLLSQLRQLTVEVELRITEEGD